MFRSSRLPTKLRLGPQRNTSTHRGLRRNLSTNQPPPPPSSSSRSRSRFSSYIPHLSSLSTRTGLPLSSLLLSFAILHELSAVLPLLAIFFSFQAVGVGDGLVQQIKEVSIKSEMDPGVWAWRRKVTDWLSEGERRVDRVSAKYGLFGYEKGQRRIGVEDVNHQRVVAEAGGNGNGNGNGNEHVHQVVDRLNMLTDPSSSSSLSTPSAAAAAASITNALGAYVLVKALFPLRLAGSMYFSPAFSRLAIEPARRQLTGLRTQFVGVKRKK